MGKELANFEERMAELATQSAALEVTGNNYISFRGGVMSFMDEPMPNNEAEFIIIGAAGEHSYYDTKFDPDNITPPVCFAVFGMDEDAAPHDDVPEDQRQAKTCHECWAHKFKSADNGRGRACGVRRRLLVVPADKLDDLDNADVAVMKIPPTSVQFWSKYVQKVATVSNRPFWMVTTRVYVERHPKFQFQVKFEPKMLIEADHFDKLQSMVDSAQNLLMQPFDMTPPAEEEAAGEIKGGKGRK